MLIGHWNSIIHHYTGIISNFKLPFEARCLSTLLLLQSKEHSISSFGFFPWPSRRGAHDPDSFRSLFILSTPNDVEIPLLNHSFVCGCLKLLKFVKIWMGGWDYIWHMGFEYVTTSETWGPCGNNSNHPSSEITVKSPEFIQIPIPLVMFIILPSGWWPLLSPLSDSFIGCEAAHEHDFFVWSVWATNL